MSKTILTGTLSKNSFGNLARQVELYKSKLNEGLNLGIEEATEKLYNLVIENCKKNNITLHDSNIYWKYYPEINEGRVWTDDLVIIFNEFGTGREGTQSELASSLGYTVNEKGRGDEGWGFYNKEHGYGGITHGLPSRHMFANALNEIEKNLAKDISITISKTVNK